MSHDLAHGLAADAVEVDLLTNLSESTTKPLRWIWDGLIPQGKVALLVGEPGVGKSLFALHVAGMVTRGITDPCPVSASEPQRTMISAPVQTSPPGILPASESTTGAVVLLASDDILADTIRPRLDAAGADLSQIYLVREDVGNERAVNNGTEAESNKDETRTFQLNRDLTRLEAQLLRLRERGVHVRLIVIDPIDTYLDHADKNLDLVRVATQLVELADRSGAAILIVANATSSGIGRAGYRSGSIGNEELANTARSVLMIVQDLECEHRRLLLPVKLNLSKNRPGLAFSIREQAIEWSHEEVPLTGEEYFTQAKEKLKNPLVREECSEITRVTNWLREFLSEGRQTSVGVRMAACENEIAYSTLRRAFRGLGCIATKEWGRGRWYWRLPGQSAVVDPSTVDEVVK